MHRIGLTPDEMLLTWSAASVPRYVARVDGLNVLDNEIVALVGSGTERVAEALHGALEGVALIDGARHARAGGLRIAAQQARRLGADALIISDPFDGLSTAARTIAIADLAGLSSLGVTSVVVTTDPGVAALFADRVAVVAGGAVAVTYPVLASAPRLPADVAAVTDRLHQRLARTA